ncbi:hypothetical protein BU24DRAFT_465202 [Aaosphaeria arxii CBS 175.79]|uniref:Uncharacterized protein n=1 Tax=Aaosphaeria arxii CBS 175.79 TaxID=1450172 RepID=A0A6A5XJ38_9PLEO|nr:uncharacterized protein BU24DRAFT_465202 [Aaosphaeria arxii CBS 175.79]KAF2012847.1 hypothetical protein BU24DRAFT_465202 [Aaosphaeria arxii CBS 175.79]
MVNSNTIEVIVTVGRRAPAAAAQALISFVKGFFEYIIFIGLPEFYVPWMSLAGCRSLTLGCARKAQAAARKQELKEEKAEAKARLRRIEAAKRSSSSSSTTNTTTPTSMPSACECTPWVTQTIINNHIINHVTNTNYLTYGPTDYPSIPSAKAQPGIASDSDDTAGSEGFMFLLVVLVLGFWIVKYIYQHLNRRNGTAHPPPPPPQPPAATTMVTWADFPPITSLPPVGEPPLFHMSLDAALPSSSPRYVREASPASTLVDANEASLGPLAPSSLDSPSPPPSSLSSTSFCSAESVPDLPLNETAPTPTSNRAQSSLSPLPSSSPFSFAAPSRSASPVSPLSPFPAFSASPSSPVSRSPWVPPSRRTRPLDLPAFAPAPPAAPAATPDRSSSIPEGLIPKDANKDLLVQLDERKFQLERIYRAMRIANKEALKRGKATLSNERLVAAAITMERSKVRCANIGRHTTAKMALYNYKALVGAVVGRLEDPNSEEFQDRVVATSPRFTTYGW